MTLLHVLAACVAYARHTQLSSIAMTNMPCTRVLRNAHKSLCRLHPQPMLPQSKGLSRAYGICPSWEVAVS